MSVGTSCLLNLIGDFVDLVCPYVTLTDPGIEWFSNRPQDCIPYRLCVRTFPDGAPPDRKSAASPSGSLLWHGIQERLQPQTKLV